MIDNIGLPAFLVLVVLVGVVLRAIWRAGTKK